MNEMPAELIQEIRGKILERFAKAETVDLSLNTPLSDLGLDSLDKVELLFEIESLFNIEIPDASALKMNSLADIVTYVSNCRGEQS